MLGEARLSDSFYRAFGLYSTVGIQLVLLVVGGMGIGQWGDNKLGSSPWLMITGILAGALIGFYNIIRLIQSHKDKQ